MISKDIFDDIFGSGGLNKLRYCEYCDSFYIKNDSICPKCCRTMQNINCGEKEWNEMCDSDKKKKKESIRHNYRHLKSYVRRIYYCDRCEKFFSGIERKCPSCSGLMTMTQYDENDWRNLTAYQKNIFKDKTRLLVKLERLDNAKYVIKKCNSELSGYLRSEDEFACHVAGFAPVQPVQPKMYNQWTERKLSSEADDLKAEKTRHKIYIVSCAFLTLILFITRVTFFAVVLCIVFLVLVFVCSCKYSEDEEKHNRGFKEYESQKRAYSEAVQKYNKDMAEYKVKWPAYKTAFCKAKSEYFTVKSHAELSKNNAEYYFKKYSNIVSPDYYDHISRIIEILNNGRADTLQQALNQLQQDLYNERILEAQMEAQYEARRHNEAMENEAYELRMQSEREARERQRQSEREARERQKQWERETRERQRQSEREASLNRKAEAAEENRKRNLERAAESYKRAAHSYRTTGNQDARKRMDDAYADMHKYQK